MTDVQDIKIQLGTEPKEQMPEPEHVTSDKPAQPEHNESGNVITNLFKSANHPVICVMHILFKFSALLWYL